MIHPLIAGLGPSELMIILAVVVLMFGAAKLPELARGTGQALRIFKAETKGLTADAPPAPVVVTPAAVTPTTPVVATPTVATPTVVTPTAAASTVVSPGPVTSGPTPYVDPAD